MFIHEIECIFFLGYLKDIQITFQWQFWTGTTPCSQELTNIPFANIWMLSNWIKPILWYHWCLALLSYTWLVKSFLQENMHLWFRYVNLFYFPNRSIGFFLAFTRFPCYSCNQINQFSYFLLFCYFSLFPTKLVYSQLTLVMVT